MKYLVVILDSYGPYAVGVRGEVRTRSRMCYRGGEVWAHGDAAILYMSRLI